MTNTHITRRSHTAGQSAQSPNCEPYFKLRSQTPGILARATTTVWEVPKLCDAYAWPQNLAGNGVIAIVELDGGWVQADVDAYFQSIGQLVPTIVDVSVSPGAKNNPNQHVGQQNDPDVEVAMDIQIAAAAYYAATGRAASIRMYWADNNDGGSIAAAIRAATKDGCDVCSISWGSDEANWIAWGKQDGKDYLTDLDQAAEDAAQKGMIVFAASGDNDSGDGGSTPTNVDAPSSCPHVVGCGGTSKTAVAETVWNDDPGNASGEGTGGGYSTFFPEQGFQAGAPHGPGRMVPDVSANADPETGYALRVHGQRIVAGGTSAVAPLYAGLFAAFGTKLGFVSFKLWANHLCFNDITAGDNGFYRGRPGPDACTGIGSPVGTKLAALFAARQAATRVGADTRSGVEAGWNGTITYRYVDGAMVGASTLDA